MIPKSITSIFSLFRFMAISSKPPLLFSLILILAPLLWKNLYLVSAASGGRMGGSAFDTSSQSSDSDDDWPSSHHSSSYYTKNVYDNYRYTSAFDRGGGGSSGGDSADGFVFAGFVTAVIALFLFLFFKSRANVLVVQVGLSGKAQALQRELNHIAKSTDTSTVKGLHFILTETALSLLRHPDYCISGYSSVEQKWTTAAVEQCFNQLSAEEREKFDVESIVNVNDIKMQRSISPKNVKLSKDYIVVTILVATKGAQKLPAIKDAGDMKQALHYLSSIHSNKLLAVEVLWTPQDEKDKLSEDELLENYPLLRPV